MPTISFLAITSTQKDSRTYFLDHLPDPDVLELERKPKRILFDEQEESV